MEDNKPQAVKLVAPTSLHIEYPNDNLIVVQSAKDQAVKYSYIYLHGLHQNGDRFLSKIKTGEFQLMDNVRVLLPTAPFRYNTRIK